MMKLPSNIREALGSGSRLTEIYITIVFFLATLLAFYVVRDFDGPMIIHSDPGVYAFSSFYFSQNVSLLPLPRLDLETSWTAYPYGINHTFLHWSFERDYFYTFLKWLFGTGPWFQLYFLVSILITALGSFFVLRRDCGFKRAAAVGIALSFLNFYTIRKFPLHIPYACVHWTVLGILIDYILVRRYWLRQTWSIRLILARFALLFLCLGLDLGYVAGYSLASFCLSMFWILACAGIRHRGSIGKLWAAAGSGMQIAMRQARSRYSQIASLSALVLLASWLYLPLSFQLAKAANQYDFSYFEHYTQWEHPLRLFIPFLPNYNPETMKNIFTDEGEHWGFHFSPGLSFVVLGLCGLTIGYRRLGVAVPFVVLFAMCLFFLPESFPTLKVFPWFNFSRAPGRATCVFPVLLAIFSLGLPKFQWSMRTLRVVAVIVASLVFTEGFTAYRLVIDARVRTPGFSPDDTFWRTMEKIRSTPGEAVFEWPFSIAPRSGEIGAYHRLLGGIFQLAQFHHKKGMGAHFGRLHPEELSVIQEAGWPALLFPDSYSSKDRRQHRDFVEEEWDFIKKFFLFNDFAGIVLYTDLLPEETISEFHARFGEPVAETSVRPGPGRVEFIPRKDAWRKLIDREKGLSLRFKKPVFPLTVGSRLHLDQASSGDFLFGGWARPQEHHRWTHSSSAIIYFSLAERVDLRIRMMTAGWGEQRVDVFLNGEFLEQLSVPMGEMTEVAFGVPADVLQDVNSLVFELPDAVERRGVSGKIFLGIRVAWLEVLRDSPGV